MSVSLSGARVAVTGATGFIGRHLVEVLVARGAEVVAVVRRPEAARSAFGDRVHVAEADLADEPALRAAFEGADAVIANAALVSVAARDRRALVEANVAGVQRTYRAIADAKVTRAVHVSTAVAYRPKAGHRYHEDDPLYPADAPSHPFNHYGVTKAAGERKAVEVSEANGIALSICRPHTVFGHHDRGTFTRWFLRVLSPPVTVFPSYLFLPAIYAGDLAEAMCRMLERDGAAGRAYNVCSAPDALSYWDLMRAYREAGGRTPKVVLPFPVPIARRYSVERMASELGFSPRPPVEAFRAMLADMAVA